jgi:hypothetical protein
VDFYGVVYFSLERVYQVHKNFDTDSFNCDLENISLLDIENLSTSSEVHNVYNEYQNAFKSVLDKHAPVKNRQPRKNPLPCMNSELRGALYRKHVLFPIYKKSQHKNMGKI